MPEIESLIEKLLEKSVEPGSVNELELTSVRRWLASTIVDQREEVRKFPAEKGDFWSLLAADWDHGRDAHFVLAVFSTRQVVLAAGRGEIFAVRDFGADADEGPDEILPAANNQFTMPTAPVIAGRVELEAWAR